MRTWTIWIALTTVFTVGASGLRGPAGRYDSGRSQMATVQPFVESVDFPKLMGRFLPGSKVSRRSVTATGVSYVFNRSSGSGLQSFPAQIGAFRDEKAAAEALRK